MKVNGIVYYPVYVGNIEIPDGSDEGDIEEYLVKVSDELIDHNQVEPIVHYTFNNEED